MKDSIYQISLEIGLVFKTHVKARPGMRMDDDVEAEILTELACQDWDKQSARLSDVILDRIDLLWAQEVPDGKEDEE